MASLIEYSYGPDFTACWFMSWVGHLLTTYLSRIVENMK